jgi:hypothetical protein
LLRRGSADDVARHSHNAWRCGTLRSGELSEPSLLLVVYLESVAAAGQRLSMAAAKRKRSPHERRDRHGSAAVVKGTTRFIESVRIPPDGENLAESR